MYEPLNCTLRLLKARKIQCQNLRSFRTHHNKLQCDSMTLDRPATYGSFESCTLFGPTERKSPNQTIGVGILGNGPCQIYHLLYPLHQFKTHLPSPLKQIKQTHFFFFFLDENKTNPLHQLHYPQRSRESHSFVKTQKIYY